MVKVFINLFCLYQEANIKGVDQDEGLSKMLDSDSSSDEENKVCSMHQD